MQLKRFIFGLMAMLAMLTSMQQPVFAAKRAEKKNRHEKHHKKTSSSSHSRHHKKHKTKCVPNDLKVCGGLEVGGNTVLDQNLIVNGNTYLGNDLTVNGNTVLNHDLHVNGDTVLGSDLTVNGNAVLEGDLDLQGDGFVNGDFIVNGTIYQKPVRKWETGISWHKDSFTERRYNIVASQDVAFIQSPFPVQNGVLTVTPGYEVNPQLIPQSNPPGGLESQIIALTITNTVITPTTITFTVPSTTGLATNDTLVVTGFSGVDSFLNNTFPYFGTALTLGATTIAFPNVESFPSQTITTPAMLEVAKPAGTFYTEELWLVYYPEDYNNSVIARVASVSPDGKSITTSSMWFAQGGGATWPGFSPSTATVQTTIAATSNGLVLPQASIDVASASAFPTAGSLIIESSLGLQQIFYTGKAGNTFTGCTGGVGILTTGALVSQLPNTSELYRLVRVRLIPMYPTWVGNVDHLGNAVVRAKMAANRNKNFQLFLLLAEQQEDGTWEVVTPNTDGDNLRQVDQYGIAKWTLSGLKQGTKYTALAAIPNGSCIQLINQGLDYNSVLFRNQLRLSTSSFTPAVFQTPYPPDSTHDVSLALSSCYFAQQERTFPLLSDKNYDFMIMSGDTIYGDYAGNALLSFTVPSNAATALGFQPIAYEIYPATYNIGTASQSATTITGVGTTFTSAMNGGVIVFQNAASAVITGFTNATTLSASPSQSVANQPYTIYFGPGLLVAPNALVTPLTITSSNNTFVLDDVQYTIPSGTYPTPQDVVNALTPLFGSNYGIYLTSTNRLIINRPNWDGYGYSEQYANVFKGKHFSKTASNMGLYAVSDDHEVFNNYTAITAFAKYQQASPTEATIAATMNVNPLARLYGVNLTNAGQTLSATPAAAVPITNVNIDTALNEYDRYLPTRFAGHDGPNERFGYVRWGQVELIQLDSIPFRDGNGNYIYYDANNEFMRQDQLDFLIERLTLSDAKVKLVLYSRSLSEAFFNQSEFTEMKNKYVQIATGLGFTASDAGSTFDKLFKFSNVGFSGAYLEPAAPEPAWMTDTFIPALEATGAKNVYFLSGGAHVGFIARLLEGSPYIDIQCSAMASYVEGTNPCGAKYGINPQIIAYSQEWGYTDVTVSPERGKIIVSFVNEEGITNVTEFDIVE